MDRVSTGSGSDLVIDQHAIFLMIFDPMFDQVATAPRTDVMKQAPPTVSAKLTAQSLTSHETEKRRCAENIYRR